MDADEADSRGTTPSVPTPPPNTTLVSMLPNSSGGRSGSDRTLLPPFGAWEADGVLPTLEEFDDALHRLSYEAMNKYTLRFKSERLEAIFKAAITRKFLRAFRGSVSVSIPWIMVVGVPIMLDGQADNASMVASATTFAVSLALAVAMALATWIAPSTFVKRHWNLFIGVSSALFVIPVFIILAACVAEGLAPTMEDCTPQYHHAMPLLPIVSAIIAPHLMMPTTGCSWWVVSLLSILYCITGIVCMVISNVIPSVVWFAGSIFVLAVPTASHMAYITERQLRSAVWLSVVNVRGAAALARTEEQRKGASARNDAFRTFASASGQLLYELDSAHKFHSVAGALDAFGVTEGDLLDQPHGYNVHPDDQEAVTNTIQQLWDGQQTGRAAVLQFRRIRDNDATIWVEMVAVLEGTSPQSLLLMASERDVTAEREARDAIALERQRRIAASAAQAAHDETLGYACHELRNPLHVIQASLSFLKDSILSGDQLEHVSIIDTASRQMHTLVDDILDVDRLRAGKLALRPNPTDIPALVQNAASQHRDFARVPVAHEIGPGVPSTVLVAGDRITQVLNNGMTNAAKFTSKGLIRVRVLLGSAPNTLRFEVRNSGVLPNRPMFRAFESTAASDAEHPVKGTGLGLRISISLVRALGGELNLENLPILAPLEDVPDATVETVFWFQIPFVQGDSDIIQTPVSVSSGIDHGPVTLGLHILYVDDEPMNRRIAQQMLKRLGCTFLVLEDGDQVMPANPHSFDAIFLDIIMQRQHGDETMRQLVTAGIRTPCFAVSGNTDQVSVQDYLRAGFTEVLGKPFTLEQVKRVLLPIAAQRASAGVPGVV